MNKVEIDMWYGDVYNPDIHTIIDCYFNDLTCIYSGNIYTLDGRTVGDFTSDDMTSIEEFFGAKFI